MLKIKDVSPVDISAMRDDILVDMVKEPSFKKKMLGYNESEVQEYIRSLNDLLENAKASFQSENEHMRTQLSILAREKESYVKQLEMAGSEIEAYKNRAESANNQIKELKGYIDNLKKIIDENEKVIESKQSVEELEDRIVQAEQELSLQKTQNICLASENEAIKNSLDEVLKENSMLKDNISELTLKMKKERAAVEGSLFSYKQYQKEKFEIAKQHVSQILEVLDEFTNNYHKTEKYILNKYDDAGPSLAE